MRTITVYQIATALNCTERNVRDREGRTIPLPISDGKPRLYALADVLWVVAGHERELICRSVGLRVEEIRAFMATTIEPSGYVPDGNNEDALLL